MLLFTYLFVVSSPIFIIHSLNSPFSVSVSFLLTFSHFFVVFKGSRGRVFRRSEKEEIVETYIFSGTAKAAQIIVAHATARVFPWRARSSVVVAAVRTTVRPSRSARSTPTARPRVACKSYNANALIQSNSIKLIFLSYLVHHLEHLQDHLDLVVLR